MSGFFGQSFLTHHNYKALVQDCLNTMKVMGAQVAFLPLGGIKAVSYTHLVAGGGVFVHFDNISGKKAEVYVDTEVHNLSLIHIYNTDCFVHLAYHAQCLGIVSTVFFLSFRSA